MNIEGHKILMIHIRKIYVIVILLMMISISISPVIGEYNQSIDNKSIKRPLNYSVLVDQYHGFYRVYNVMSNKIVPYQNDTLNIYKGDTITWRNDAVPDYRLTIISQQKLWDNNSADLKWAYKLFTYTFNTSGIYEVYVRQYTKFGQKIIVGPIELNSTNTTKVEKTNKVSGQSSKNVSKSNSSKTANSKNSTNTIKTIKTNNVSSQNSKNTSKSNSSKTTNSKNFANTTKSNSSKMISSKNSTNVSKGMPENVGIGPIKYLIIGPIKYLIMLSIVAIHFIICTHRKNKNKMT